MTDKETEQIVAKMAATFQRIATSMDTMVANQDKMVMLISKLSERVRALERGRSTGVA